MKTRNLGITAVAAMALLGAGCATAPAQEATNRVPNLPVNAPLLGGDRDEHGCIGSAGYSWCEPKQKCLRVWEETCGDTAQVGVQKALAEKYGKPLTDVNVTVRKEEAGYARGGVSFGKDPAEGGMFLAKNESGIWKLAYDGNGSVDCRSLKDDFGFPADMLSGFCD